MAKDFIDQNIRLFIETAGTEQGVKGTEALRKSTSGLSKDIDNVNKQYKSLGGTLMNLASRTMRTGVSKSLEYHKSMLQASAGVNRLGVSIGQLEKGLTKVSRETALTRIETLKLFNQYQKSMAFVTMGGFEQMMLRIRKAVGTNVEAMQEMLGAVISLSDKFPILAAEMEQFASLGRQQFIGISEELYGIGELGREQFRWINSYLNVNEQVLDSDGKRKNLMEKNLESINNIARAIETIQIDVGEKLVPALEKVSEVLTTLVDKAGMFVDILGGAIIGLGALKGAKGILTLAGVGGAGIGATAATGGIAAAAALGAWGGGVLLSENFAESQAKKPWLQKLVGVGGTEDFSKVEQRLKEQQRMGYVPKSKRGKAETSAPTTERGERLHTLELTVRKLDDLYSTYSKTTDVMIENIAIMGDLSSDLANRRIKEEVNIMTKQLDINEKFLRLLTERYEISVDEVINSNLFLENEKQIAKEAKDLGKTTITTSTLLSAQERIYGNIAKIQQQIALVAQKILKQRELAIRVTELEASQTEKIINLYDNFAIGVGATASMRVQLFLKEAKAIEQMEAQLKDFRTALMDTGNSEERNRQLRENVLNIENKILDARVKQAQTIRSIRDGWVSAISAMNTGAGIFSEIVMNAEQNVAQVMRLPGAVRSAYSGAFAGRGRGGRVLEDIGFRSFEQFNQQGQISARGRGLFDLSYLTFAERMMGMNNRFGVRGLEMGQREDLMRYIERASAYTASGGLGALTVGSNEMRKSYVGGGQYISPENLERLKMNISNAVTDVVGNAVVDAINSAR